MVISRLFVNNDLLYSRVVICIMSTARMQFIETLSHLFHPRRSNNHRPRLLHTDSYFSFIGISIGFAIFIMASKAINPQLGYILGYASDISVNDVVAQTNVQRATAGLPPLTFNATLAQAANAKAQDMFAKQYWAHKSPEGVEPWAFINGSGYTYVAAGENLARDFMNTGEMINAWMGSPTHKANIMNPRYQEIGIAVVNGSLEGMETTLVVQMFGRPTAETPVAQLTPESAEQVIPAAVQPETVAMEIAETKPALPAPEPTPQPVLASSTLPASTIESSITAFSPLQLSKAFAVAILLVLIGTLAYDWFLMQKNKTVRLTGKNTAHIIYFVAIIFIVIVFKGGFVF